MEEKVTQILWVLKNLNNEKKSILINYSRGNIVDIKSLIQNIKKQKILGAALDVFQKNLQ